ncbi:hypothetical protein T10_9288 [Trichinella papuae]|uniref:Uncharacterized protein n=1 Tax=Trichinella papuae TaxID=268474 RepID=A0A0V1N1G9_9BILA|nr:hypothetical protein T10_9288 [Trichinella papuae]
MTRHVSLPPYRTPPSIFKSKCTTVAECNSDVVHDQFCLSSSSSAVSGIEQASSASRTVTSEGSTFSSLVKSELLGRVLFKNCHIRDVENKINN